MGNSNSRQGEQADDLRRGSNVTAFREAQALSARNRGRRGELGLFGAIANNAASRDRDHQDSPFERRETKQEREARRLERERVARAKERERSIREEHVDGGYLVTLGTYTGTEDFSKPVVRQLLIERKLAPFWRGLNDWSSNWAEHQLVAAARGLPIPAADEVPDPELLPKLLPPNNNLSSSNLQTLTMPMGDRTLSTGSDRSASGAGSGLPSPAFPGPSKTASFKPRAKALAAALSGGSRNASSTDLTPKEIDLPHDPFVNGQLIEVYLYKDATECPICFLSYPPYLNSTRCCDQAICSECFVQIKRSEPHLPEHHPDAQSRDSNAGPAPDESAEKLISEPSACPYCQQPDFGVTYEPPPFRRGLAYPIPSSNPQSATAMSSQSSLHSTLSPNSLTPVNRRRTHSLSANAPNVITTDRVRPDWATKLASARAHQARRAAAATALHTAAFLMGGNEQRSILRGGRFSRRNTGSNSGDPGTPNNGQGGPSDAPEGTNDGAVPGLNSDGSRRTRMDELEDMMFMEAVRLSLAAEEERKRKEEKAYRKEAKKREQADRKAQKKQSKDPYGPGGSSASGSSLSLSLGRLRGNSGASNLRVEATVQGATQASKSDSIPSAEDGHVESKQDDVGSHRKGKAVERNPESESEEPSYSGALPMPVASNRGGSHLRQMSNASSMGSSLADTPSGSYTGGGFVGPDGNRDAERDTGIEPMFNFRSLAELVGVNIEDGSSRQQEEADGGRPLSQVKEDAKQEAEAEHVESGPTGHTMTGEKRTLADGDVNLSKINAPAGKPIEMKLDLEPRFGELTAPELTITPETPAPDDDNAAESKQLGHSTIEERWTPTTQ